MGSIISGRFGNIPQRFQHTCLNTVIHLVAPSQGSNASSKKDRIHLLLFSTWPGIGNLDPHDLYTLGSYTSHPHQELPSEVTKDCVAKEKAVQLAPGSLTGLIFLENPPLASSWPPVLMAPTLDPVTAAKLVGLGRFYS